MRARLTFLVQTARAGWQSLGLVLGLLSLATGLTVLAALLFLARLPVAWAITFVLLLLLPTLMEGAYRESARLAAERHRLLESVRLYEASNSPTQEGIANLIKVAIELRRRLRALTNQVYVGTLMERVFEWTGNVDATFENGKFYEFRDEFHEAALLPRKDVTRDRGLTYLDSLIALLSDMQRRLMHSDQDRLL